jgi:hypothetical protein
MHCCTCCWCWGMHWVHFGHCRGTACHCRKSGGARTAVDTCSTAAPGMLLGLGGCSGGAGGAGSGAESGVGGCASSREWGRGWGREWGREWGCGFFAPRIGGCALCRNCDFHQNSTPASAIPTRYRVGLGGRRVHTPWSHLCIAQWGGGGVACVYIKNAMLCHATDRPAHPHPSRRCSQLRSKIFRGQTWGPKPPFPTCCGARRRGQNRRTSPNKRISRHN